MLISTPGAGLGNKNIQSNHEWPSSLVPSQKHINTKRKIGHHRAKGPESCLSYTAVTLASCISLSTRIQIPFRILNLAQGLMATLPLHPRRDYSHKSELTHVGISLRGRLVQDDARDRTPMSSGTSWKLKKYKFPRCGEMQRLSRALD